MDRTPEDIRESTTVIMDRDCPVTFALLRSGYAALTYCPRTDDECAHVVNELGRTHTLHYGDKRFTVDTGNLHITVICPV